MGEGWRKLKSKRLPLFFVIFLLALAFVYYWRLAYFAFDVSMYLVAARQILSGAVPYVDIIDINPPLVLYINVLFVWLMGLFKIPALEFYDLSLLAANIGMAVFLARKLRALGDSVHYAAIGFLAASLHALIAFQYGQREHLFMTLFVPYFCWRWEEGSVKSVSFYILTLATGVLAFLKPGFLAILVSYELVLFIYKRKISVGHWALLSIPGTIYLAHFMFLPKEVSQGFWVDLVPMVLSRYGTMGMSWTELREWWGSTLLCYLFFASLYVVVALKSKEKRFALLLPIGICSFVAIAYAVVQQKGWDYHLIPVQFLLYFGFPIALRALHQYVPAKINLTAVGLLLFFLLGQRLLFFTGRVSSEQKHFSEECGNDDLKSVAPHGSSIVIFSIHPCFSYPIFYEQSYTPGTRYVSLFPLAFFNFTPERLEMFKSRFPTESDLSLDERKFVDNLKIDFKRKKPDFIIFPKLLVPDGFDPYRYAISTGIFSEVAMNYQLIQNNDLWRVYRRL